MKYLALIAALAATPSLAGSPTGIYQTEPGDSGGFLYVSIAPCGSDAALTCGTILAAYDKTGTRDDAYQHLGKPIVWDMVDDGDGSWSGGMIWAPDRDKTYSSNMELQGSNLRVEGCVAIICRGQTWRRVQ